MKPDEGAHPMDINLLRPYAVVQIANALAPLVEHFHGLKGRQRCTDAFRDRSILDAQSVYSPRIQPTTRTHGQATTPIWGAGGGVKRQDCLPITKLI